MRNPLRSEEAAFHLVWLAIGYFGLIAVASAIDRWLGLAAFVVETAGLVAWWVIARRRREQAPPT